MITKLDAIETATKYLEDLAKDARPGRFGTPPKLVLGGEVVETWYGWVFEVVAEAFQRTKDPRYVLVGGIGAIAVLRDSGGVHTLGTSIPPQRVVSEFETRLFGPPRRP